MSERRTFLKTMAALTAATMAPAVAEEAREAIEIIGFLLLLSVCSSKLLERNVLVPNKTAAEEAPASSCALVAALFMPAATAEGEEDEDCKKMDQPWLPCS